MPPYFLTAAALKAASANKLTRAAYRSASRLKNDPPCDIFLRVAVWCLDGLPSSRQRLLDLGTGWIHAFALFAALLREDDELHCFDTADIRKWKCFQATLPLITEQLPGQVSEEVLRQANQRADLIKRAESFDEVYQILNMSYQWREDGLPDYPDNYFDRIFSVDVLEHVDAELFPKAAEAWLRILKPGGQFYAQVGIDDHLAYQQGQYGSKRYLRYSHEVWDWLLSNQVQYINRFTKTQIVELIEAAGFVIDEVETDLGGDTPPEKVHPDYGWQSSEDIRAVRLYVRAHKPSTS